jgi:phosphate-selective porin OprO/OprP
MKEGHRNMLDRLLLLAMAFGLFTPLIAQAAQDNEARIKKLEEEVEALKSERGSTDLRVFWKEGLRFETPDKNFSLKLGGRIFNDWAWMRQDSNVKAAVGDLEDGTEFRTTRLYTSGTINGNVDYKAQFDFSTTSNEFKDVYLGIRDLPIGYLKMGHFKEPFGLEELASSRFVTFMERSLANTFVPARNTGFALSSTASDNRATWAAGVFRNTDGWGEDQTEGGYNATGRVTALPWYEDGGASLLHLGAAYSFRNPDSVQYATEPEAHLAPDFVDTTSLATDKAGVLGIESALVCGPFSLQGEYMMADVDGKDTASSPTFDGFYIQGSYFLTGEHREYKTSSAAFDRVKPKENYSFKDGGTGAWEMAARYSEIDLDEGSVTGGELKDVTVGLNWRLNPNTRIMWNYVRADLDGVGDSNLFMMRMQVDF